jgi:hypothetical protein
VLGLKEVSEVKGAQRRRRTCEVGPASPSTMALKEEEKE